MNFRLGLNMFSSLLHFKVDQIRDLVHLDRAENQFVLNVKL